MQRLCSHLDRHVKSRRRVKKSPDLESWITAEVWRTAPPLSARPLQHDWPFFFLTGPQPWATHFKAEILPPWPLSHRGTQFAQRDSITRVCRATWKPSLVSTWTWVEVGTGREPRQTPTDRFFKISRRRCHVERLHSKSIQNTPTPYLDLSQTFF